MNWEIRINPCVKRIASGTLLYSTGSSAWCFVMTYKGVMGCGREEREREGVYIWLIHFIVQQELTQCSIVKQLYLN